MAAVSTNAETLGLRASHCAWRSTARFQFGLFLTLEGPASPTLQRVVVYVFPASVHPNMSVSIQTDGVGHMFDNTSMRTNLKRNNFGPTRSQK
eukprot:3043113-Amphidinium_carterae.1